MVNAGQRQREDQHPTTVLQSVHLVSLRSFGGRSQFLFHFPISYILQRE